ncbi:hypothetical protein [Maritalea sp.]|uniref:hypothetical protein n=1 Tax=Maritalea sp. TaxID=2003361 RepID=UPI003EF5460E
MKKTNMIIILSGFMAAIAANNMVLANEYPRTGIGGVTNGVASSFVGEWSIHYPEGSTYSASGVTSCEDPVRIESTEPSSIVYQAVNGDKVEFILSSFMDRTVWMPAMTESTLAVWTTKDEFFAYQVDLRTGKAKWEAPLVYRRCDVQ